MALSAEFKKAIGDDAAIREIVDRRTRARMSRIDSMPRELRECVHEYGFHVVNTIVEAGVSKPRVVRHIVETILNEFSPTRGSASAQGRAGDYYRERKEASGLTPDRSQADTKTAVR